ncbi:cysteine hydrolase family protein [Aneurinibacillus sp. Ricciae_BoGa-3]|uniref:cysteine hydrolase family protein n=1 Tax=Aneurinibacillus sp. Ricciae_BoGa-3 TaxID=3022697 RepID=UPI0023414090|nr:cysteine hydrolase family protein [Aneurinibacillus sp. Ricciae_BoGa-3]WCK53728.1 cysteine hydrolase family protein [Aneurinibacillus sp. Ricciae_BoGa-3]
MLIDCSYGIPDRAALIIVDVQKGFDDPRWGNRNNLQAETNISRILQVWRKTGRPVLHIQHLSKKLNHPLRPEASGSEFKECVEPLGNEPIFQKNVNSAFIGTNLEQYLREHGYNCVVIVGLTTDHCISTTARMAGNLGFKTYVISDATATFDRTGHDNKHYDAEDIHNISLASLHDMFATVVRTADLIEQLMIS